MFLTIAKNYSKSIDHILSLSYGNNIVYTEAVIQSCSVKKCSWKFHKIHRETPMPEPFFNKVAGLSL